ncbi:MAG: hypothetical protein IPJ61_20335 [Tessaracoccus sp.]|uniref:hypothetical protein n=1 Tax=Tessaracoccus sp. TaxID=1971211 RepID=UPI001EC59588|nr:hypothetical protein [Tessaracoccus sp.]MBK7823337.1 hypothetical protein [Tessaracoccus sp.]
MPTPFTTLRALAAQAAEGTSAPSTVLSLASAGPYVEVRITGGSLAGSPTSVTFGVWRGVDGGIDKIGTFTVAAADIGGPLPPIFEFDAGSCWVRVESFAGGTGPTLTGTIQARPWFG